MRIDLENGVKHPSKTGCLNVGGDLSSRPPELEWLILLREGTVNVAATR